MLTCLFMVSEVNSLRASSPISTAYVLARLTSLAKIGELAGRL